MLQFQMVSQNAKQNSVILFFLPPFILKIHFLGLELKLSGSSLTWTCEALALIPLAEKKKFSASSLNKLISTEY